MFWTFRIASFSYQPLTKTFAHHRHLEQIHLPQILHLTQNTLSDHQNNGAIGKLACLDHLLICYFLLPLHTIIL